MGPTVKIHRICNAYESAVGHGLQNDDNAEPPYTDTDLNEAWKIGYNAGIEMADEKAAIKKDIGQILSQHLERDVRYQHEHGTMRQARWNRARAEIDIVIERHFPASDVGGSKGDKK